MHTHDIDQSPEGLERLLSGPLTPPNETTVYNGDQLYTIDPERLAEAQLALLKKRFHALVETVPALKKVAEVNRMADFETLDEAVPLLLPHTAYKSYPASLLANGMFGPLNEWLDDFTSYNLRDLDVSKCETIDEWLDVVETHTPLRIQTSSGTSGKCSLLPRSTIETGKLTSSFSAAFAKFRDDHGINDYSGPNRFHTRPRARYSRYYAGILNQAVVDSYKGDERQLFTFGGELPTDALWMTGQMNKARAEGTLERLKKSEGWKRVQRKLHELEVTNLAPMTEAEYARRMIVELKDQPIVLMCGFNFLWSMVEASKELGVEIRFAPDSLIALSGGVKTDSLTEEQRDEVRRAIPNVISEMYGFSEATHAQFKCSAGHHHPQPWQIQFVLDRDSGAPLPRRGVQTGRAAAFDLWAETYWGGFVSGDEVTINWDGGCACGRTGPYLHADVGRYTDKYDGSDKITCQRSNQAVQELVEHMQNQD